ncbi:hypothetical protein [Sphingomonas sp.]|jgi:uncharacterized iron-regulated membrane protein|uniref:hypothetical protein n=1 Tax=Sphingomonas sp. TaxID=28214 RepID=UPI002E3605B0|nr:hypothetical protein [Sphingomonas sp.]HEX4693344.1 hypothetical protein [Sphingomonas sp.]
MTGSTLLNLRRWHRYIGVFLAPAVLFYTFSGFIQVLGWQDQRNPAPPAWVSWIAGIHKKQVAPKPRPAAPAKPASAPARPPGGPDGDDHDHEAFVPLKIFALLTALGLFVTTMIGLAVALGTRSTRRTATIVLVAGIVVPAILMVL